MQNLEVLQGQIYAVSECIYKFAIKDSRYPSGKQKYRTQKFEAIAQDTDEETERFRLAS